MGAMAEALVAYAKPLRDATDGTVEDANKAFALSQLCYNLALVPEGERDTAINELRPSLSMDDQEFQVFRRDLIIPMIERHKEMFSFMHGKDFAVASPSVLPVRSNPSLAPSSEAYPGTDRYAPCPCKSGEKYKFCCGKKRR
jgi:hypothetical protein